MLVLDQEIYRFQLPKFYYSWVIVGHHYYYWNGLIIPFLIIKNDSQTLHVPFVDTKYFLLSEELYCKNCLNENPRLTWNGLCESCQGDFSQRQYACIYSHAGEPFGGRCDISSIALCNDEDFRTKYCLCEYVIYLGRFGNALKIGITRFSSDPGVQSYIFRLIDQGFDSVLVFRGINPLNLTWAQDLETEIGRYFCIPKALSFDRKFNALSNLATILSPVILDEMAQIIEISFPELTLLESMILSEDYWGFYKLNQAYLKDLTRIPRVKNPRIVEGEVVMARGEMVLLEKNQRKYWLNLRDLHGRAFYSGEE